MANFGLELLNAIPSAAEDAGYSLSGSVHGGLNSLWELLGVGSDPHAIDMAEEGARRRQARYAEIMDDPTLSEAAKIALATAFDTGGGAAVEMNPFSVGGDGMEYDDFSSQAGGLASNVATAAMIGSMVMPGRRGKKLKTAVQLASRASKRGSRVATKVARPARNAFEAAMQRVGLYNTGPAGRAQWTRIDGRPLSRADQSKILDLTRQWRRIPKAQRTALNEGLRAQGVLPQTPRRLTKGARDFTHTSGGPLTGQPRRPPVAAAARGAPLALVGRPERLALPPGRRPPIVERMASGVRHGAAETAAHRMSAEAAASAARAAAAGPGRLSRMGQGLRTAGKFMVDPKAAPMKKIFRGLGTAFRTPLGKLAILMALTGGGVQALRSMGRDAADGLPRESGIDGVLVDKDGKLVGEDGQPVTEEMLRARYAPAAGAAAADTRAQGAGLTAGPREISPAVLDLLKFAAQNEQPQGRDVGWGYHRTMGGIVPRTASDMILRAPMSGTRQAQQRQQQFDANMAGQHMGYTLSALGQAATADAQGMSGNYDNRIQRLETRAAIDPYREKVASLTADRAIDKQRLQGLFKTLQPMLKDNPDIGAALGELEAAYPQMKAMGLVG